jgi:putative Mg2+ transporter-C (MgtC) family protein
MSLTIGWSEIALRLALTVVAGALLGFNRTERGRAAGLRTVLLVSLAASASMIQVNLLLNTAGKQSDSFVVMDLMRLPLGILTGMGFIGAGAIVRQGDLVTGITTAATLWLATALGLCFGGGQHGLGLVTLVLGLAALWGLRWPEARIKRARQAILLLSAKDDGPTDQDVRTLLEAQSYQCRDWSIVYVGTAEWRRRKIRCEVHWYGLRHEEGLPPFVQQLGGRPGVLSLKWKVL